MADWDDNRDDPHGGDAAYMLWPHKLLVGAVQQSGWCGEVHPNNSAPWDSFKSIEQCNTSTKIGCLFNVPTPRTSIGPAPHLFDFDPQTSLVEQVLEDPEERTDLALTQPALAEDIYQRMLRAQDTWFNPDRGQPDPRACEVADKTGFWGPFVEEEGDAATEPPIALASKPVAKPSPQQLAWQDLEVSSMLGWNLQTICRPRGAGGVTSQRCQASSKTEGPLFVPTVEQIAEWDPYNLDTDEWAKASASFGAKYVIIVADHMTGFTWWNTKYHNYSIAHTRYKGGGADVVREMIASCKKYNLKLGFFYSVHFNWFLGVDGYKVRCCQLITAYDYCLPSH